MHPEDPLASLSVPYTAEIILQADGDRFPVTLTHLPYGYTATYLTAEGTQLTFSQTSRGILMTSPEKSVLLPASPLGVPLLFDLLAFDISHVADVHTTLSSGQTLTHVAIETPRASLLLTLDEDKAPLTLEGRLDSRAIVITFLTFTPAPSPAS